jgi:hypothetical protein
MIITVLFKDGVPKGILKGTLKENTMNCRTWWTSSQEIEVPEADWNTEKVTLDTIKRYL